MMKVNKLPIKILIVSNIVMLVTVATMSLLSFSTSERNNNFQEITAERINIVNADGTPVIAISNKERIANPIMGGKKYPVSFSEGREYMAGLIFFNESGDEMGGLVFNSFKMPNGRVAGMGHLSFDRFNDNQVIALEYNENKSGVRSGLTFYDRPGDGSFKKSLDLVEEAGMKTTSSVRLLEIKDSLKVMNANKSFGAQRLFIGSRNETAQLELKDKNGFVRGRFYVSESGEAKLEFINVDGEITDVYPR